MRSNVFDLPSLRGRRGVFADRADGAEHLASLLAGCRTADTVILAIPRGGISVGRAVADHLRLPLEALPVARVTMPANAALTLGAIAFDGTVHLDRPRIEILGVDDETLRRGVRWATERARQRWHELRHDIPMPDIAGHPVILVDDGVQTGATALAAIEAARRAGAAPVTLAVVTAPEETLDVLARSCDAVICANIRPATDFAIGDAFSRWEPLSEHELGLLLRGAPAGRPHAA